MFARNGGEGKPENVLGSKVWHLRSQGGTGQGFPMCSAVGKAIYSPLSPFFSHLSHLSIAPGFAGVLHILL